MSYNDCAMRRMVISRKFLDAMRSGNGDRIFEATRAMSVRDRGVLETYSLWIDLKWFGQIPKKSWGLFSRFKEGLSRPVDWDS